ncbi:RES family NAD+ phosphorylase [Arthrobacter sp. 2MCAF15]|uniref:RES family NAD+ phosphorylase n=1 Tax=Arthrobacter sp. 2MCAF15 TaxID=3232984 RepID=UPI003F8DC334
MNAGPGEPAILGGPGEPPNPFDPIIEPLHPGTVLWRVHDNDYTGDAFHPGGPDAKHSRFSFFGTPKHVPVLYLGKSEECAIAETILHDKVKGSMIDSADYADKVLSKVTIGRKLRLVSFRGFGLTRLGTTSGQLTASPSRYYDQTRPWAETAHGVDGVHGIIWTSARFDEQPAYMLFGDRVGNPGDLDAGDGAVKAYGAGDGLDDLIEICRIVKVRIRLPRV